ncbi:hypothetical protein DERP_011004, partial [Dermatophagoides pteronyssinus]
NSNKIQTLSKCLDQEQQQHLMTRSISQRRPPPPPPPRPPSSSISSPSNQIQMTIQCICCKQCCPNCQLSSNHHHQQRKHSMKSNPDSSLSSKTMSYQCTTNGGQPNKRMSNPRIHSMHGLTRAKIKTVKITLVVITCYVLCSLPFICVQLWAEYWPNAQESPIYSGPIIAILMLLPSLNSCVNPWIYIYFNPNLITLFCQFFKRKSSSDEPLSKSGALLNNNNPGGGAGGGGNGGGFKAKFQKHYRQTSESPDCSLSLTDNTTTTCHSTRLVTRQNDFLVDMNKPGAGFRYMATNHRMWLKLSSNKNNGNNRTTSTTTKTTMIMIRSNKQQQKQQYPAKSSQLRLLNKATNVECVVNDDQYIV